ncbi:MAG: hypothetical protein NTZ07_02570 [Candidatus Woesebacteria bacterium]|nr:hypothetical protein [Candidatus Woesebacteria bacterium]
MYDENTNNINNKYKRPRYGLYVLIIVVILLLILILFLYLIRSPLIFRSGAFSLTTSTTQQESTAVLSLDNSYVFASPLRAKANGEQIRITVFVLNDRGMGMSGKKVTIGDGNVLQVASVQPVTDSQGRATFDISASGTPGVYIIQAATDGVTLTQKATVSFD